MSTSSHDVVKVLRRVYGAHVVHWPRNPPKTREDDFGVVSGIVGAANPEHWWSLSRNHHGDWAFGLINDEDGDRHITVRGGTSAGRAAAMFACLVKFGDASSEDAALDQAYDEMLPEPVSSIDGIAADADAATVRAWAETATRDQIIAWLQRNDPNGSHTDALAWVDECDPYTRERALEQLEEMLEDAA